VVVFVWCVGVVAAAVVVVCLFVSFFVGWLVGFCFVYSRRA